LFGKLGRNEVDGFIAPTWENKKFREQLNLPQKRNKQKFFNIPALKGW
jgi:hypothetical protein